MHKPLSAETSGATGVLKVSPVGLRIFTPIAARFVLVDTER
jgi:hypothetical protein